MLKLYVSTKKIGQETYFFCCKEKRLYDCAYKLYDV